MPILPPPTEPDSPLMQYDDEEPELDGLRHLSVSTDGTIDSLVSLDENPTPPHSPLAPTVRVSPPGASFSFGGPRALDFAADDEDHPMMGHLHPKEPASGRDTPIALATPVAAPELAFFGGAVTPVTPPDFQPQPFRPGNLAQRRAISGSLPNKALLSLQQMRFESSKEAGMGLGVGPPSSGLELSPGGPGFTFRAAMGLDGEEKGSTSPLPSPGVENIALDSPTLLGSPAQLRRSPQSGKMPRSPGTPNLGSTSSAFKPSLRNANLRINLGGLSPATSPLPSPNGAPPSPLVRTSAFHFSNTGPRTPLTPSHLPGAPALGAGGGSFEWHAYSFPDSPGCPVPPPGVPVASDYFSDLAPVSPSSSNGTYLPTPGSERGGRTPFGMHRPPMAASPLGQGRFASSAANPFFA
ncbi:hypothetical protein JCM8097_000147 [Rhodosporidiobolus ruineniae]